MSRFRAEVVVVTLLLLFSLSTTAQDEISFYDDFSDPTSG